MCYLILVSNELLRLLQVPFELDGFQMFSGNNDKMEPFHTSLKYFQNQIN